MNLRQLVMTLALCRLAAPIVVFSQVGTQGANQTLDQTSDSARPRITFEEYLTQVVRSNLSLAIARSNVDLSKAAVTSAKVTPDWSIDVGLPVVDISNQGQPTNFSTSLNLPIELGGKRGKRVHAARADLEATGFDYEDAVRQLRATAAGAFIASLSARDILQSSYKSLGEFDRIVEVNEQRVRVGDIGEIELMQSQVNRDQFKAGGSVLRRMSIVRIWLWHSNSENRINCRPRCLCQADAWKCQSVHSIPISWWQTLSRSDRM